jgi:hypothetical protein
VARSVERCRQIGSGLLLATGLGGCVTTQQLNARAQLRAQRELAGGTAVRVTRPNPFVRVLSLALVRGRDTGALAVRLRNVSNRPSTDLPISVGLTSPTGHHSYLNGSADEDYFQNHVAAIGPRSDATWVFTSRHSIQAGAQPFAKVGIAGVPPSTTVRVLPRIEASAAPVRAGARRRSTLPVEISNLSPVPQYELQVYAVATRSGRVLAAGRGAIVHLGTRSRAAIVLTLTGNPDGASVEVDALPTIFK